MTRRTQPKAPKQRALRAIMREINAIATDSTMRRQRRANDFAAIEKNDDRLRALGQDFDAAVERVRTALQGVVKVAP